MKHLLLIAAAALLAGLLTPGAAIALPICDLDCNANSPCDQVCWVTPWGPQSTCAMYICDEPTFPWLTPDFEETLTELALEEKTDGQANVQSLEPAPVEWSGEATDD